MQLGDESRINLAYAAGPRCSLKTDVDLTTLLVVSMSILRDLLWLCCLAGWPWHTLSTLPSWGPVPAGQPS